MKQKAFFYLSVLLLGFAIFSVQAQSLTLNIVRWTGEESSVNVSSIDKITFSENDLIVNYKETGTGNIDLLSIRKITFGSNPSNIENINVDGKISISVTSGNQAVLSNLPEGNHKVSLYSISGSMLKSVTVHSSSPAVDISSIGKGVYIILVNNQAIKFVKS
jgi:hypothetical protein